MKGRGLLVFLLFLALCGCRGSGGREPADTAPARILGIDKLGSTWRLTAVAADGAGKPVFQQVEGDFPEEIFADMPAAGDVWISLHNVTAVLLGDGVPPADILPFLFNHSGMSWQAVLWSAPGAGELLGAREDGGVARLELLQKEGADRPPTVLAALAALEGGREVALPVLGEREGCLVVLGWVFYEKSG